MLPIITVSGALQDLDLETMHLFLHFFSVEELINELQVLDLSVRELTIVKATILQELARQIVEQVVVRNAVRARVHTVRTAMRPSQGD